MSLEYLMVGFSSRKLADDAKAMLRRDKFTFIDCGDVMIGEQAAHVSAGEAVARGDEAVIFVGQAPARDGSTNLEGPGVQQLLDVMGVTRDEFMRHERLNLLDYYPGDAPTGDLFDHQVARERASELSAEWNVQPSKVVILLGWAVQRAFLPICPAVAYFKPCSYGFLRFYVHHLESLDGGTTRVTS